jgi:hypothetical protein
MRKRFDAYRPAHIGKPDFIAKPQDFRCDLRAAVKYGE